MKICPSVSVLMASVAAIAISVAGDTPSAATHIDAVAAFYGISREDIRYFPNELYDCLREYASRPESREVLRIPAIDEQSLLKDATDRLAVDPSVVAVGLLGTACFGAVHQRGATGMYEVFRQSGQSGSGRMVNVVGGRELPPQSRKLDEPGNLGVMPLDEDHLIVRLERDGTVRIRETYTLTDGENVALYDGEWTANFAVGKWEDYVAGRSVVLTIPVSECQKRRDLVKEFLATPEVKQYFRLAAALAIAEMSGTDNGTEPKVPDFSGMLVDVSFDESPNEVKVFMRGNFLLWLLPGRSIIRYEVRRDASK